MGRENASHKWFARTSGGVFYINNKRKAATAAQGNMKQAILGEKKTALPTVVVVWCHVRYCVT